jgi:hypothetical protein
MAEFLTRQQVTDRTGVPKNRLLRWIERGLLPPLSMRTAPGGRGQQGVWPASVLPRVQRILELQAAGHGLDAIHATLAQEDVHAQIDRIHQIRAAGGATARVGDLEHTYRDIFRALLVGEFPEAYRGRLLAFLEERGDIYEIAWKSHEDGSPLVLVLVGDGFRLLQGWRLSEVYSLPDSNPFGAAVSVMVPLYGAFVRLANLTDGRLPVARRQIATPDIVTIRDEKGAESYATYAFVHGKHYDWLPDSVRFTPAQISHKQRTRKRK